MWMSAAWPHPVVKATVPTALGIYVPLARIVHHSGRRSGRELEAMWWVAAFGGGLPMILMRTLKWRVLYAGMFACRSEAVLAFDS